MSIEVHRDGDRYLTEAGGRSTWHSFSFGQFFDPANLGFASIIAHNDEVLPPGTGYDDHRHSNTEIVTWVLEGALRHTDSAGHSQVLGPGDVQRISAGDGITHAEVTEPGVRTRFLQTWLRPDEPGGEPAYARSHWQPGQQEAGLTEVVGPDGIPVRTAGARLFLGATGSGQVTLPDAARMHVFVVSGHVLIGDRAVRSGDAARLTGQGGRAVVVEKAGRIAVWAFDR